MADKRPKTPAGTIKHEVYDEAVDADDDDDEFGDGDELDVGDDEGLQGSMAHTSFDSNVTLESCRPSLVRAAGAAGAVSGAGGLFNDNVTLESIPTGPYQYESKPFDEQVSIASSDERNKDASIASNNECRGKALRTDGRIGPLCIFGRDPEFAQNFPDLPRHTQIYSNAFLYILLFLTEKALALRTDKTSYRDALTHLRILAF